MDSHMDNQHHVKNRSFFRRSPWENTATAVIALGIFMLMQPFSKWAYAHSFPVLLLGFVGFTIVSHFPEDG